jgi:hypothetical protein
MYNFTDKTSGTYTQLQSDDGTWYRVFDDGVILGLDDWSGVYEDTLVIESKLGCNKQFFAALRKEAETKVDQEEALMEYSPEPHTSPSINICEIAANHHPECIPQYLTTEQLFGFEYDNLARESSKVQHLAPNHNITVTAEHINLALNDVSCDMVLLSSETIAHGFAKICNRAIEIAQSERVPDVESDGNYF